MNDPALDLSAATEPRLATCSAMPIGTRALAMAADGSWTAATTVDGVHVLAPDRASKLVLAATVAVTAAVDGQLWIAVRDGAAWRLHVIGGDGAELRAPLDLGELGDTVSLRCARSGTRVALVSGIREVLVIERGDALVVEQLGERNADPRLLLGPGAVFERRGPALVSRRGVQPVLTLPVDLAPASVVSGGPIFDGAACYVEVEARGHRTVLVYDLRRGELRSRIRLGAAVVGAVAERSGQLVLVHGQNLALLDLRRGTCVCERMLAAPMDALCVDANGERFVIVEGDRWSQLGARMSGAGVEVEPSPDGTVPFDAVTEPDEIIESAPVPAIVEAAPAPAPAPSEDARRRLADVRLEALRPRRATPAVDLDAYLSDARAWVGALCRTAVAVGWDCGRSSRPDPAQPPYAVEIDAIAAVRSGRAAEPLATARAGEREAAEQFSRWNHLGAPHVEIAHELGLTPIAGTLLLLAAAPQIWGELARAYAMVSGDPGRPLVDELLLAHLLEAESSMRTAIAREFDEGAPLIRSGAIEIVRGVRPYASIAVHPIVARRLAGDRDARGAYRRRTADRSLDVLHAPRAALTAVVDGLVDATEEPPRIVIRGRAGSGRRTIAACLAAQAGRHLGLVEIDAHAGDALEARLRQRLREVALAGDLPCVSIDELAEDVVLRSRIRAVLDDHAGPLFVRAAITGDVPLVPGYQAVELPALTETERRGVWRTALVDRDLPIDAADALAARFTVGPGVVATVCDQIGATSDAGDTEARIATAVRQHRSARIGAIAARVDRLAAWDDLIVSDDIADSLREVLARVRHRRTVVEDWGMDRAAAGAHGVTALFQGGPGTGKTMAAGVLARALGYELWRVDLSKVMSKWIGETEKNLGAVFDAAEDGEIVLLFDEADSLFGKRTEVKSSHDRNANAETNYLLQRLDAFSGIAILTTNFGTAIDPAFKRRVSVQVQFPFPDETERQRLWRAHLPASLPIEGELDLAALAHKYQLSGGYIRNSALRAAYLAAADERPLSSKHLYRAVALEYQRTGKLGDGRLE